MENRQWEQGEGPRDRLLSRGADALSDAELLGVLLQTGYHRRNAVELAAELLGQFGGLVGLMRTDAASLLACRGVGRAKYAVLQAAMELARRQALKELEGGDVLSSPGQTRRFLQHHLGIQGREVFSTLDGAAVYPREVAVRALQYRAAAVIFAHNHPSGVAEPSSADRRITERLCSALALLDIRVLDHIIVGRGREYSFAEQGLL